MSKPTPESFEYACQLAVKCSERARVLFAKDQRVAAVCFILARRHQDTREPFAEPKLLVVSLSALIGGFGKDVAFEVQRQLCEKTEALGIINVAEAWSALYEEEGGVTDLSELPSERADREKIVFLGLEHVEGSMSWKMRVVDGEPPTLGALEEIGPMAMGRMTGIFKKEEVQA